ncbi:hypothetical protein QYM36_015543 [Artemia franciscana]|uniref:Uncharacterized protein n=1 Tax=Artemia franciscana TaxID=6661 RepID=A0AA88L4R7_ARTSF|nr:hypothetical protein QYM36_015543 [Artemia franciscana]
MDSLVLHGLKQKLGSENKKEVYSLIKEKTRVSGVQENQIVSVFRFRLNNANEDSTKVAPVLIRISDMNIARAVYKEKSALVKSGMFLSESLTRKKRELLNAARDRYKKFNAGLDKGQVLAKVPGQSALRRIKTMADCI